MSELWHPRSTCDTGCLPPPDSYDRVGALVAGWRAVVFVVLAFASFIAVPAVALLSRRRTAAVTRSFARAGLAALGIRHRTTGRLPARRALLVSNHVSWLDVLVVLAHSPAQILAKHHVRDWPLIGRLARRIGTVFVDRTRPKTLTTTVAEVRASLAAGGLVAVFPEGTTWCGRSGGRFRSALFQSAVDAGAPVVPMTLSYYAGATPTTVAAFLGDETLVQSLRRLATVRRLSVELRAHPMLHPEPAASRRALARAAGSAVYPDPHRVGSAVGVEWGTPAETARSLGLVTA